MMVPGQERKRMEERFGEVGHGPHRTDHSGDSGTICIELLKTRGDGPCRHPADRRPLRRRLRPLRHPLFRLRGAGHRRVRVRRRIRLPRGAPGPHRRVDGGGLLQFPLGRSSAPTPPDAARHFPPRIPIDGQPRVREMEEQSRIAPQRRYIERRAEELLERIPFMDDAELRWTVRVLQDCLPPAAQEQMLLHYSEHLELHQMRHVVQGFVSRYTEHALQALEAKRFTPGTGLEDLTDEELQSMSAAEKWSLLQRRPRPCTPISSDGSSQGSSCASTSTSFTTPASERRRSSSMPTSTSWRGCDAFRDTAIEELKEQVLAALSGLDLPRRLGRGCGA